jgi:hypothetical protein
MKSLLAVVFAVCLWTSAWAQGNEKVFGWVFASDEFVRLDPGDYFGGRVYRPGPDGGNIHVIISSRLPITIAMAPADEWNATIQHPEAPNTIDYRCMRDHITTTTYECHLPSSRRMVLVIYDERAKDRAVFRGIGAVLNKGTARAFIAPNDVKITYHSWSCVNNCIEPEFGWVKLAKEKYQLTSTPKMYGMAAPLSDGEKVWVKIKAQVPMTLAVIPSNLADQIYAQPNTLNALLSQTTCKQRGVQQMEFDCTVNMADGPQSLLVLPDQPLRSKKKAELEVQTYKCVNNCNLLANDMNQ